MEIFRQLASIVHIDLANFAARWRRNDRSAGIPRRSPNWNSMESASLRGSGPLGNHKVLFHQTARDSILGKLPKNFKNLLAILNQDVYL